MNKKSYIILSLLLLIGFKGLKAQQEFSMHYLGKNVYQSLHLNPAFMPEQDNYGIISHYFNFSHSGFALEDVLFQNDTGWYDIRIDSMLEAMKEGNNFLNVNNTIEILSFKWKYRRQYYAFGIQEKLNTTFYYPKDFMSLALKGNAAHIGDTLDIGLGLKANHYREYYFNYMHKVKRWDLGFRVKLLTGFENLSVKARKDSTFFVTSEDYSLHASYAYNINMAGHSRIQGLIDGTSDASTFADPAYFMNFSNLGLGFDLGGVYTVDKKLKLSISLLDIGAIHWKNDVANQTIIGEHEFSGLDVFEIATSDGVNGFGNEATSIQDTFTANNLYTESSLPFKTNLVPKHYMSVNYNLVDSFMVSAIWYGEYFEGYHPGFSFGLNKQVWKIMNLGVNYSIKNRSYTNLGGSVVLNLGPIQIYAMSDNFYSLLDYRSVRNINLRWGLNARFTVIRPRYRAKEG